LQAFGKARRALLRSGLGLGAALPFLKLAAVRAADNPEKMRPQPGDRFVFLKGDNKGEVIKVDDLPLGGPQEIAYPIDPATGTVRKGSRLNQVALIRLADAAITDRTRRFAAEGVVVYSAVCTHQGCPVSMWQPENDTLYCSCHGSEYNPGDMAEVVAGPAPRRLAILPVKVEDGVIVAAGEFEGAVGFKKPA